MAKWLATLLIFCVAMGNVLIFALSPDARAQVAPSACLAPPPGFDPLHASAGQLLRYGLPLPPNGDQAQIATWAAVIRQSAQRDCHSGATIVARQPPLHGGNSIDGVVLQPRGVEGAFTSPAWSGYVATDGGFDWVSAQWSVSCWQAIDMPPTTAATWVGLGGWFGTRLLQGGTTEDWRQGYRFWVETYADGPFPALTAIGPQLRCGDQVAVQVDYNVTCSRQSSIHFTDLTSRYYTWTGCIDWAPSTTDAEWITERLRCASDGGLTQLEQTTPTLWTQAEAESTYYENQTYPAGFFDDQQVTMTENSKTLATPGPLRSDGFTINWLASGTASC